MTLFYPGEFLLVRKQIVSLHLSWRSRVNQEVMCRAINSSNKLTHGPNQLTDICVITVLCKQNRLLSAVQLWPIQVRAAFIVWLYHHFFVHLCLEVIELKLTPQLLLFLQIHQWLFSCCESFKLQRVTWKSRSAYQAAKCLPLHTWICITNSSSYTYFLKGIIPWNYRDLTATLLVCSFRL